MKNKNKYKQNAFYAGRRLLHLDLRTACRGMRASPAENIEKSML